MPRGERTPSLKDAAAKADGRELAATIAMGRSGLKKGGPAPLYPETPEGLERFMRDSDAYLSKVQASNEDLEGEGGALVPDIEAWAAYMGTTRATIATYERSRGEDWKNAIASIKGIITACKKQLAFTGKMPPVLAIFDLTNNSGYVNASEYHLTADAAPEAKQITAEEWERVIDAEQEAPELANFELPDNLS